MNHIAFKCCECNVINVFESHKGDGNRCMNCGSGLINPIGDCIVSSKSNPLKVGTMSKQIKGVFNASGTDYKKFYEELVKDISELQINGQEVEVQYETNICNDGKLVHSALILGRVVNNG